MRQFSELIILAIFGSGGSSSKEMYDVDAAKLCGNIARQSFPVSFEG